MGTLLATAWGGHFVCCVVFETASWDTDLVSGAPNPTGNLFFQLKDSAASVIHTLLGVQLDSFRPNVWTTCSVTHPGFTSRTDSPPWIWPLLQACSNLFHRLLQSTDFWLRRGYFWQKLYFLGKWVPILTMQSGEIIHTKT